MDNNSAEAKQKIQQQVLFDAVEGPIKRWISKLIDTSDDLFDTNLKLPSKKFTYKLDGKFIEFSIGFRDLTDSSLNQTVDIIDSVSDKKFWKDQMQFYKYAVEIAYVAVVKTMEQKHANIARECRLKFDEITYTWVPTYCPNDVRKKELLQFQMSSMLEFKRKNEVDLSNSTDKMDSWKDDFKEVVDGLKLLQDVQSDYETHDRTVQLRTVPRLAVLCKVLSSDVVRRRGAGKSVKKLAIPSIFA